jgi:hypothetical protein
MNEFLDLNKVEKDIAEVDSIVDKINNCMGGHGVEISAIALCTVMARLMFIKKISGYDIIQILWMNYSDLEESERNTKH